MLRLRYDIIFWLCTALRYEQDSVTLRLSQRPGLVSGPNELLVLMILLTISLYLHDTPF